MRGQDSAADKCDTTLHYVTASYVNKHNKTTFSKSREMVNISHAFYSDFAGSNITNLHRFSSLIFFVA